MNGKDGRFLEVIGVTDEVETFDKILVPLEVSNLPVKSIRSKAFAGTAIKSIRIERSVERVGDYAFCGCYNLMEVAIENPNCVLQFDDAFICNTVSDGNGGPAYYGTIMGYNGSTAQAFAARKKENGENFCKFVSMGASSLCSL